ncbi:MAG: hypothetical protein COA84_11920 [Robiginitomaculum sp.]|nr:MAG: hypothetical protein COA84_11920 [Robiginitomaculum sp.]
MDDFRKMVVDTTVHFIEIAKTEAAIYIYIWALIFILTATSIIIAFYLLYRIRNFKNADLIEKIRGPAPQRKRSIVRRIKRLKAFTSSVYLTLVRNSLVLFIVGIIMPGILLGSIAAKQSWLLPGTYALELNGTPTDSIKFARADLLLFVTDQALRGSLSDTLEVFDYALTDIQNNPKNILFSIFVLFYRALSGFVAASIFYVGYRIIRAVPHVRREITKWELLLEALLEEQENKMPT